MENRERDRLSKRNASTEAGKRNREVSEQAGQERNSGTSAEFGQSIGRSEFNDERSDMDNRNRSDREKNIGRSGVDSETSRRSGSYESGSRERMPSEDNVSGSSSELGNESSRRSGSGSFDSSTGRSRSDLGRDEISGSRNRDRNRDSSEIDRGSSGIDRDDDISSGRH